MSAAPPRYYVYDCVSPDGGAECCWGPSPPGRMAAAERLALGLPAVRVSAELRRAPADPRATAVTLWRVGGAGAADAIEAELLLPSTSPMLDYTLGRDTDGRMCVAAAAPADPATLGRRATAGEGRTLGARWARIVRELGAVPDASAAAAVVRRLLPHMGADGRLPMDGGVFTYNVAARMLEPLALPPWLLALGAHHLGAYATTRIAREIVRAPDTALWWQRMFAPADGVPWALGLTLHTTCSTADAPCDAAHLRALVPYEPLLYGCVPVSDNTCATLAQAYRALMLDGRTVAELRPGARGEIAVLADDGTLATVRGARLTAAGAVAGCRALTTWRHVEAARRVADVLRARARVATPAADDATAARAGPLAREFVRTRLLRWRLAAVDTPFGDWLASQVAMVEGVRVVTDAHTLDAAALLRECARAEPVWLIGDSRRAPFRGPRAWMRESPFAALAAAGGPHVFDAAMHWPSAMYEEAYTCAARYGAPLFAELARGPAAVRAAGEAAGGGADLARARAFVRARRDQLAGDVSVYGGGGGGAGDALTCGDAVPVRGDAARWSVDELYEAAARARGVRGVTRFAFSGAAGAPRMNIEPAGLLQTLIDTENDPIRGER